LFLLFCFSNADVIKIAYAIGSWPPLSYKVSDSIAGAAKDFSSDIFSELNLEVDYVPYNDLDNLEYALRNNMVDFVLMSTDYNDIANHSIKIGPSYFHDTVVVLSRDVFTEKFGWRQLQGRLGAILSLDQIGSYIDQYNNGFLSLKEVYNADNAIASLLKAKVDYIIASKSSIDALLKKYSGDTSSLKMYDLDKLEIYLSVNKNSSYKIYAPFLSAKISHISQSNLFDTYIKSNITKFIDFN